jgi:type III secretion protein S
VKAPMEDSQVLYLTSRALLLVLLLSAPTIVVASVVGVVVGLIQALTQIQDQTLSFAIKLVAVVITIFATAAWLGSVIFEYAVAIFDAFPVVGR